MNYVLLFIWITVLQPTRPTLKNVFQWLNKLSVSIEGFRHDTKFEHFDSELPKRLVSMHAQMHRFYK